MKFTEKALQENLDEFRIKERKLGKKLSKIRNTIQIFESLQTRKERKINRKDGEDEFEIFEPIDRQLNEKMTPKRKQEIFDNVMAKKQELEIT